MRRVSTKAVLAGAAIDLALTVALAIPIYAWLAVQVGISSLPEPDRADALMEAAFANTNAFALLLVLGCACSVVGGYIAGSIARRDVLLNGGLSGVACMLLGVFTLVTDPGETPRWLLLLTLPLGPALGALGGELWSRRSVRQRPPLSRKQQRSWLTRVLVTFAYATLIFVGLTIVTSAYVSSACLEVNECTAGETRMLTMLGLLLLLLIPVVTVAGLMGLLPGARRSIVLDPEEPEPVELSIN